MKIREISLSNFKRFTETTISGIPQTARLVLLVGPNGCGKSSLIDAAHTWYKHTFARMGGWEETYHAKQTPQRDVNNSRKWRNQVNVLFYDPQPEGDDQRRKAIYARSAYRNDPEFEVTNLQRTAPLLQDIRLNRLIDNDQTVGLNYQRIVSRGFADMFQPENSERTLRDFTEGLIGDIRGATLRLFPDLQLNSLGDPLAAGTFRFDKGESKGFLYKNLSGGEKAAFDLLLDLLVRRREFDDTVFFIDEPDAHMSAALQSALLVELYRLVPENSQLWLATHSIGMMRKARELWQANPGSVMFIDFDGVNFDIPNSLQPVEPSRPFWKRAMQIALDELAGYVSPGQVVLCEGGQIGGGSAFDAQCYNEIFQHEFADTIFLGAGNSDDIENDPRGVGRLLSALAPNARVTRLIDRDERTDEEIMAARNRGVQVLSLRTIESYLLDDAVLRDLCAAMQVPTASDELLAAKRTSIAAMEQAGYQPDDIKRSAGDIYNAAKRLLSPNKLGSTARTFMSGKCAPLIRPGTPVYAQLRRDIFGR